jgi:hypothetical protein
MNGAALGMVLVILVGGSVATVALMGGPPGGMMGGGSSADCAGMHPGMPMGHTQCSQEARMGSHAFCDPMGMSPAQCREMQSYMAGSAMTGPCH